MNVDKDNILDSLVAGIHKKKENDYSYDGEITESLLDIETEEDVLEYTVDISISGIKEELTNGDVEYGKTECNELSEYNGEDEDEDEDEDIWLSSDDYNSTIPPLNEDICDKTLSSYSDVVTSDPFAEEVNTPEIFLDLGIEDYESTTTITRKEEMGSVVSIGTSRHNEDGLEENEDYPWTNEEALEYIEEDDSFDEISWDGGLGDFAVESLEGLEELEELEPELEEAEPELEPKVEEAEPELEPELEESEPKLEPELEEAEPELEPKVEEAEPELEPKVEEKFKHCTFSKGMSIEEYLRKNPNFRDTEYVEHFFSKEAIQKSLVQGSILVKKGKYRI